MTARIEEPTRNVNVLFHESMLEQIEQFQFRELIVKRTDAIRVLITRGLKVKGKGAKRDCGGDRQR